MSYYSVEVVANTLLYLMNEKGKGGVTPMKMQKLLYFAQAWRYNLYKTPLFEDDFYKWDYGPVIPDVYFLLKKYGAKEIGESIGQYIVDKSNDVYSFLERIVDVYGDYSAFDLSNITHMSGSAWDKARYNDILDLDDMASSVTY